MTDPEIHVRMYRRLLGDCFLIRVVDGGTARHILIDCGVLQGTDGSKERMTEIADDIFAQTGGVIDLLVVTHEHWDHISGFGQAKELFFGNDGFQIKTLWMAWTERRDDAQANRLRARFAKKKQAVALVADAAMKDGNAHFGAAPRLAVNDLDNFIGVIDGLGAAGKGALTGDAIMRKLAERAGETLYLEPGTTLDSWEGGLKAHVLGPPRDEKLLFKDLPTKSGKAGADHSFNETLLEGLASDEAGFDAADHSPFSGAHRGVPVAGLAVGAVAPGQENLASWFSAHYHQGPAKRRIDADWLGAAGALALKLNSDTNNTSLVLAFEIADGAIMLFAADAQVGNWESWWSQPYAGVKMDDLLPRVAFYKVGHHGSHNATLIDQGLRKMGQGPRGLVAMIPTDEAFALKQGKGWRMPDATVRKTLIEVTGGKLIYGDRPWRKLPDGTTPDPAFTGISVDQGFRSATDETNPLFVEYRVQ